MNSKRRFVALGLVASATMLNYLDRAIIGVAAPAMSQDLQLDPMQMGWIFSAFTWSYVLAQLPCGALLDHMGSRRTYCLSITAWSAFMGCQALCMNFYSAFAMRLGLGAAEAPCFPGASRIVAAWFPQSERARATSIYTVGEYIGIAALSPLLYWMMPLFGWRMLFVVMGFVGFVFAAFWWKIYRDPHEDLFVSQDELNLIKAGGALVHQSARPSYDWATIRRLLSFRQIWGAGIGSFAGNATLVFFLTWYPTYLVESRGIDVTQLAWFTTIPYMAAAVGILSGGYISDLLIEKTGSLNVGRKLPIVAGLIFMSGLAGANFVESNVAVIAILSIAFFGQGLVGMGWTVVSDIAPAGYQGVTGGLFNIIANSSGILTPIAIGAILSATGSFTLSLIAMSVVGGLGALAYVFLLGDIHRLEL